MNKHLMKILILYGVTNKSVSMNDRKSCPEVKSADASFASISHSGSSCEIPSAMSESFRSKKEYKYDPNSEYRNISLVNSFSSLNELNDDFVEIKNWKNIVSNLDLKLFNSKGLDHDYAEVLNNLTDEKISLLKNIQNKKNIFINYNQSIFKMFDELNSKEKEFMKKLSEEDIYNYYKQNKDRLLQNKNDSIVKNFLNKALSVNLFNKPINIEMPKIKKILDAMIINDFYINKISGSMIDNIKSLFLNFKSWEEIEIKAIQQLIHKELFFENFEKITNAYYLNEEFNKSRLSDVKEVELDQVVEMAKKFNFEGLTDVGNTRKIKLYENKLKESEDLLEYYKYMSFSYLKELFVLKKDTTNFINKMKELKLIPSNLKKEIKKIKLNSDNFSEEKLIYSYVINEINYIQKKNKSVMKQEELIKKHFEKKLDGYETNFIPSIFEQFITDESLYEFLFENQTIAHEELIFYMDSEEFKSNFRTFIENNISKLKNNNVNYDEKYLESLLSLDILKKVILNKVSKGEDVTKIYLHSFLNAVKEKELSKCTFNFIYEKFNSNITFKIENIIKKIDLQKNKINNLNESEIISFENKKIQLIWKNFMNIILDFLMDEDTDNNNLSQEMLEFNELLLSYLQFELFKSISDLNKYYSELKDDCNNINFNNLRVAIKNLNHYDKCFLVAYEFIDMCNHKNEEDFTTTAEMFQDNRCKFKEMIGELLPLISHKIEKEEANKEKNFVKEYVFSNKKNELDLEFQFGQL